MLLTCAYVINNYYIIVLACAKRHMRCRGMEKLFKRLVLLGDEDY